MEDRKDDFDPLFDYSRVQPLDTVCLDDEADEDTLRAFPSKRQKVSDVKVETEPKSEEVIQIKDEDEDWLPPAVKIPADTQNREEDPFLKALRLRKEELLSCARSAEKILQSANDDVKKDCNTSVQSSSNCTAEPLPKPPCERRKIVISIQDKIELKHFRVYMDDKFEKLFRIYADKVKLDMQTLVFTFDGEKVSPTATPAGLDMEDNDILEVHVKPR